jgi:hypothetical protein
MACYAKSAPLLTCCSPPEEITPSRERLPRLAATLRSSFQPFSSAFIPASFRSLLSLASAAHYSSPHAARTYFRDMIRLLLAMPPLFISLVSRFSFRRCRLHFAFLMFAADGYSEPCQYSRLFSPF